MILNDRDYCSASARGQPIVSPHQPSLVSRDAKGQGVLSFGQSSFGYDLRCGVTVLTPRRSLWRRLVSALTGRTVVDPKRSDPKDWKVIDHRETGEVVIPPRTFFMVEAHEYIVVPDDAMGVVMAKSSYARCGIMATTTPLEPGWAGYLTLEFYNSMPFPVAIWPGEGIAQMYMLRGERPAVNYRDRKGKYQNQPAVPVLSRV